MTRRDREWEAKEVGLSVDIFMKMSDQERQDRLSKARSEKKAFASKHQMDDVAFQYVPWDIYQKCRATGGDPLLTEYCKKNDGLEYFLMLGEETLPEWWDPPAYVEKDDVPLGNRPRDEEEEEPAPEPVEPEPKPAPKEPPAPATSTRSQQLLEKSAPDYVPPEPPPKQDAEVVRPEFKLPKRDTSNLVPPPAEDIEALFNRGHRRNKPSSELIDPQDDGTFDFVSTKKHPRTFADLFAMWPQIGQEGKEEFHVRVERELPKTYRDVNCAGYIGRIYNKITEEEFIQTYGGQKYKLAVYGPVTKRDGSGEKIIKALCQPITHQVPVVPPNLLAGSIGEMMNQQNSSNPFTPYMQSAPVSASPTNDADAKIVASKNELTESTMKLLHEEKKSVEDQNRQLFQSLDQRNRDQMDAIERRHEREMQAEREEKQDLKTQLEELKAAVQEQTGSRSSDMLQLVTALRTDNSADARNQYHAQQLETLRHSHAESMKHLRDQLDQMARDSNNRQTQQEEYYQRKTNDLLASFTEERRRHEEDKERIRREERDRSETLIRELKDRQEQEVKNLERSFEREIRSIKDGFETKMHATTSSFEMQHSLTRERLDDARREAEQARQEAAEAADIQKVMDRARQSAEAMGYIKDDSNEPKTPLERFAATAGAGVGQALSTVDQWAPQIAAAIMTKPQQQQPTPQQIAQMQAAQAAQAAQMQRQLPAHAVQPQQPPKPKRKRADLWATENTNIEQGPSESKPLGFEESPNAEVPTAAEAAEEVKEVIEGPAIPEVIQKEFAPEVVDEFIGALEQHQKLQTDPSMFAMGFMGQFPAEAKKVAELVSKEDIVQYVESKPGSEDSSLLLRDGQKWLGRVMKALKNGIE